MDTFVVQTRTDPFPVEWEIGNIVSVFEKVDEQHIRNCCPVSFAMTYGGKNEKLIFREMLEFFMKNDLINIF